MADRSGRPAKEKNTALQAAAARQRLLFEAIETALSMGEFQGDEEPSAAIETVLRSAAKNIRKAINFTICGLYLVDQPTVDILLWEHCATAHHDS